MLLGEYEKRVHAELERKQKEKFDALNAQLQEYGFVSGVSIEDGIKALKAFSLFHTSVLYTALEDVLETLGKRK